MDGGSETVWVASSGAGRFETVRSRGARPTCSVVVGHPVKSLFRTRKSCRTAAARVRTARTLFLLHVRVSHDDGGRSVGPSVRPHLRVPFPTIPPNARLGQWSLVILSVAAAGTSRAAAFNPFSCFFRRAHSFPFHETPT